MAPVRSPGSLRFASIAQKCQRRVNPIYTNKSSAINGLLRFIHAWN